MMMVADVNFVRVNDPNANIFIETNALRDNRSSIEEVKEKQKRILPRRWTIVGQSFERFLNAGLERISNNVCSATIRPD